MKFILVFYFGTILGSFYALCVDRVPQEKSVIYPSSQCNRCNNNLRYYDMIPIFSFMNLKGRCRECGEKIGIQSILIEILTGIIFISLFFYFNFSLMFIKYIFLFSILIISAFIDYNTKYVFSKISLIGIVGGFIFLILDIIYGQSVYNVILGIVIPMGIIFCIYLFTKKIQGIGGGDLEIFFLLTLYLNLQSVIISMYLSIILVTLGEIIKRILGYTKKVRYNYIAFVPYIAIATFISVIFSDKILQYCLPCFIF